jgi:DUF4097 and DUF4098 domain-containing protein YvlB
VLLALTLAALVVSGPDTTVAVQKGQRLELSLHHGDVTVDTWSRSSVRVQLDADEDEARVRIDASGGTLSIGAAGKWGAPVNADFTITVPSWMALSVNGVEGDVTVTGVAAPISVQTVNGDVKVRGGDGVVTLHSVEGDVTLAGARGRLDVQSVNSDVSVTDAQGDVAAQSVNGSVQLLRIDSQNVEASSVNGDVTYSGTVRSGGRYHATTHNGDVRFGMPEGSSAVVSVSTFQGDFESDFPVTLTKRSGKSFSFTLGGGGARVELESFQGTIRLERPGSVESRHR